MAKTFLNALEAPFAPEEFKDEYGAELEAMIAKKAAQVGPAPPASEAAPTVRPVMDILEAFKKSMAMERKPAASETQPARKAPGKVTGNEGKRQSRKAR